MHAAGLMNALITNPILKLSCNTTRHAVWILGVKTASYAEPIIDAMGIPCVKSRHSSRKYVSEQVVYGEVREKFNKFLSL
jgi:hypothetical protein